MTPPIPRLLPFLLPALLVLSGCAKNYTDAEHVEFARKFQSSGDSGAALIELKNAVQKNPRNAEARWLLGEVYATQGFGREAEAELKQAAQLGIKEEALKPALGLALLGQREFNRILRDIEPTAGSSKLDTARILDLRGRALLGLGQRAAACPLFDQAIAADGTYAPAHWGKAGCRIAEQKFDEARAILDNAAKLGTMAAQTWVIVGDLERGRGRLPDAASAYDQALGLQKTNIGALLGRAATRIQQNQIDAAKKDIDAVLADVKDHPLALHLKGVTLFGQKKYGEAQISFESALSVLPDYLPSILWLGLTHLAQQQYEQAASYLGTYVKANPSQTRIGALYAMVKVRLGDKVEAKNALEQLGDVKIDDPQSVRLLAQASILVGEYDAGAKYLGKVLEAAPDAGSRVALAGALLGKGDRKAAIRELEKALELNPGLQGAEELLVLTLINEKQLDKALQAIDGFQAKQPKSPLPLNYRGAALLLKGDVDGAKQAFRRALELQPGYPLAARNLAAVAIAQNNFDEARGYYKQVLERDNANLATLMDLYRLEKAAKRDAEAVKWLDEAMKRQPKALEPVVAKASDYLAAGQPAKALEITQPMAMEKPRDATLLELRGQAFLANGEIGNGIANFKQLSELQPNSAASQHKLGMALMASGNTRDAAQTFRKAVELDPGMIPARSALVAIDIRAGRFSDAMNGARQVEKQIPDSAEGPALQGDVLMAEKKFAQAAAAYQKAYAMSKTLPLAAKLYAAHAKAGRRDAADALLEQRLKEHPDDHATRLFMANALLESGRAKLAMTQYELLLKQSPNNVVVLNNLANAAHSAKDERALGYAEQAYKLKPDNTAVMDTLGWILLQQGKTSRATELLQKAHDAAAGDGEIHYHYAAALAKLGEKEKARRELKVLLAREKAFPSINEAKALLAQL